MIWESKVIYQDEYLIFAFAEHFGRFLAKHNQTDFVRSTISFQSVI